jgi:hypothetical protein
MGAILKPSRQEMINELMEGVAFEDDATVAQVMRSYQSMTDAEIRAEYVEVMGTDETAQD